MRKKILFVLLPMVACDLEPTAPTVTISPSNPTTGDDLVAIVEDCSDCKYRWFRNGGKQPSITGDTVDADLTLKDDLWSVIVTSLQANGSDGPEGEAETTVFNTAPSAPEVGIAAGNPVGTAALICEIEADSVDADEDEIVYSISWSVDSQPWTGDTTTTAITDDTIAQTSLETGQIWECLVVPNDGVTDGTSAAATASIESTCLDKDDDGYADSACGGTDCDDSDPLLNQDDADQDGYSTCEEDCDDNDASLSPDNNCGDPCWSLEFDGIDDGVYVENHQDFEIKSTDFTIEAFYRSDNFDPSAHNFLVSHNDGGGGQNKWVLGWFPVGDCCPWADGWMFHLNGNQGEHWLLKSTENPVASVWEHIAVVRSGSTLRLYRDGKIVASTTYTGMLPVQTGELTIGTAESSNFFDGRMAEIRISRVARYTAEFSPALYTSDADTIAYWPMNHLEGGTVKDNSGNGHDGAIQGATWVQDCPTPN